MIQEEKYKEALLEARAVLEPCLKYSNGKVREALDSIDKELKRFESEDEGIRKELKEAFEAYDIESSWNGIPIRSIFAWLEKQKEQKPVVTHGETYHVDTLGTQQVIAGKMPQKPAEWSEEDEKMLKCCLIAINHYEKTCNIGDHLPTKFNINGYLASVDKVKSWLKSLRPHWKPSEEQMKALEAATVRYQSTGLESLYENLKKL